MLIISAITPEMEQKTLKEVPSDDLSCVTNPAKDKNRRAAANTPHNPRPNASPVTPNVQAPRGHGARAQSASPPRSHAPRVPSARSELVLARAPSDTTLWPRTATS